MLTVQRATIVASMSRFERLQVLDELFLHLEGPATPMHVGGIAVFDGAPPDYQEFLDLIGSRLHKVPRFRQKLVMVPFGAGRPLWVDDALFDIHFHVRHTALPAPGGESELKRLVARIMSQQLDRSKPLWEIWLVEGVTHRGVASAGPQDQRGVASAGPQDQRRVASAGPQDQRDRFALISKTHHCLIDGIAGVDLMSVLLDLGPEPQRVFPQPWEPAPAPTDDELLSDALQQLVTSPGEVIRTIQSGLIDPGNFTNRLAESMRAIADFLGHSFSAPESSLNAPIGPHRRFETVFANLEDLKRIKNALGGTVNDVVLSVTTGALRTLLQSRGERADGVELRAMIPVSVRTDEERGKLGNRIAAMWVTLPLYEPDPVVRLNKLRASMKDVRGSGQAIGAQLLTSIVEYAPPTLLGQAARLIRHQRAFNVVITNIPGPQFPLYTLGRELKEVYPVLPLAANTSVGVALFSYNGTVGFGLLGDYDLAADLEVLAEGIEKSIAELLQAASGRDYDSGSVK
jgi:diacylglycerol O-acyltransferase / wax synthase